MREDCGELFKLEAHYVNGMYASTGSRIECRTLSSRIDNNAIKSGTTNLFVSIYNQKAAKHAFVDIVFLAGVGNRLLAAIAETHVGRRER
jgi:hypothetical protein